MKKENNCAGSYMNGNGHQPPDLLKKIPKDGVRGLWTYWNQSEEKSKKDILVKTELQKEIGPIGIKMEENV